MELNTNQDDGSSLQKPIKLTKPFFYKKDSNAKNQLEQLKEILKSAPERIKSQIEQDIKMLSYGIAGEENVAFELNNSHLPIIVLHDLNIGYDGLSAQIDYLIITRKFVLVIECKNLIGNIEVNSSGDFIRTTEYKGKNKKEGIYSPITQNMRHLELIKNIKLSSKNNFITKAFFEKVFDDFYKDIIVLANPKTVINMKYAKKEVKEKIIRCDQLNDHIKTLLKNSKEAPFSDKDMFERAESFLSLHGTNTVDYTKKYILEEVEQETPLEINEIKFELNQDGTKIEDTQIYKALKQFRYEKSKEEGVKAYIIFNNAQMEALILAMPSNLDDIRKVQGFGDVKCQKYGDAILEIIKDCLIG